MALQVAELLALQEIDNRIGTLEAEKGELDNGERVERALASRMTRLQQAERRLQGLQIEHRNAELELAGLEEKKHSTSRKLYEGRGTNPRELMALEQEVAMLERQRQRLSDTILRGLDDIEKAGETVTAAKAGVEEAEKALRIVKKRYERMPGAFTARWKNSCRNASASPQSLSRTFSSATTTSDAVSTTSPRCGSSTAHAAGVA
jgi:predicted  nucleic acid-binding Zn-ribbon protein